MYALIQVVLCLINMVCHQLAQNATTGFAILTKIFTNCSEIQNSSFQVLNLRTMLRKS